MANLGIPIDPEFDPREQCTSYLDSSTNLILKPQDVLNGSSLQPGNQLVYFYVVPQGLTAENPAESGWNHFTFLPNTTVITDDLIDNLVLCPNETPATTGLSAYAITAPYDCVMTLYASCLIGPPFYMGQDTGYTTQGTCSNYLVVGKNYNLTKQVGGYTMTDGYERQVSTQGNPYNQYIYIPYTTRTSTDHTACLACTYAQFKQDNTNSINLTVFTTALLKKGDQISVCLFLEPQQDEDNYNMRQQITNFSTQIGFTRATLPITGPALLTAINPAKPKPMVGAVYGSY